MRPTRCKNNSMKVRARISHGIRERILRRWGIPYNRHGLDFGLFRFFSAAGPINYVDVGASAGNVAASVEAQYGIKRGLLVEPQPARCEELRHRFATAKYS